MDKADITVAVDVTGDPRPSATVDPGTGSGADVPRPSAARWSALQLLFHAVIRAKLKASPPDILLRPAVGAFRSADFFKIDSILAAAEPSREELKRKLAQRLERVT
jgi:NTE family protein